MKIGIKLTTSFLIIALFTVISGYVLSVRFDKISEPLRVTVPKYITEIAATAQLDDFAGLIRYYDEVLTQSARNYAFTQNVKWRERYRDIEPKLDEVIKEAIVLGNEKDKAFFSSVDSANIALVEMEYESIDLVENGQLEGAVEILESNSYWDQKAIYKSELENYVQRKIDKYGDTLSTSIQRVGLITEEVSSLVKESKRIIIIFSFIILIIALTMTVSLDKLAKEITERKKAKEKANQALVEVVKSREVTISMLEDNTKIREELENKLGELEKSQSDLQKAYAELKETQSYLIHVEKMEAVGRMASGVAHEVKNPLAIILQGVNYFEDNLSKINDSDLEVLKMLKDNINRANDIISSLVDFSREKELKIEQSDINSILEEVTGLIKHGVKLENIKIVKEFKKNLPKVLIDKSRITQVFVNLFLNAIQAMPQGGKLYIRTYLSELSEIGKQVGRRESTGDYFKVGEKTVVVEVEDTGSGISEEDMTKIFEPFFTTKGPKKGTGLGLSVTKNILDMHKAIIDVESKKDKGTKIVINLKIDQS